jgi:F-type H+-transporting ATPase subunit delta
VAANTMHNIEIARRYAKALYDLAKNANVVEKISVELNSFADAYEKEAFFKILVESPLFSIEKQKSILKSIECDAILKKFVQLLCKNKRLYLIDAINKSFKEMVMQASGQIIVDVTSAKPMNDNDVQELKNMLEKKSQKKVSLNQKNDSSLMGGMIIQIGSTRIDSSLKTRLDNIYTIMKGVA